MNWNTVMQQLPLSKTPGLDGLPVEFYRTFWPVNKTRFLKNDRGSTSA